MPYSHCSKCHSDTTLVQYMSGHEGPHHVCGECHSVGPLYGDCDRCKDIAGGSIARRHAKQVQAGQARIQQTKARWARLREAKKG
jgi:hypothetical protein